MRLFDPIPHAAARLLWMSKELTLGQKAVWQQLAAFPETGCFMSAENLGRRVGLSGEFAERTRRELKACGLARQGQRQPENQKSRRGRPAQTWFAAFPEHLVPASRSPTDENLASMIPAFDAHVLAASGAVNIPTEGAGNEAGYSRPSERDNALPMARSASRGEGGRGEGSPHSQTVGTTETPSLLHTPCTEPPRTRDATSVPATVRPALARTLARGTTAELDRAIEGEGGETRLTPRDLQEKIAGWEQRLRQGAA